jgi:transcriptional regulator with XRE-family HTH domain
LVLYQISVIVSSILRKEIDKLYDNFRQLIEKKGITPYRVAKDTKIPTACLSDWKNGKSVPKVDKLVKIADYLGVPLEELVKKKEMKQ